MREVLNRWDPTGKKRAALTLALGLLCVSAFLVERCFPSLAFLDLLWTLPGVMAWGGVAFLGTLLAHTAEDLEAGKRPMWYVGVVLCGMVLCGLLPLLYIVVLLIIP